MSRHTSREKLDLRSVSFIGRFGLLGLALACGSSANIGTAPGADASVARDAEGKLPSGVDCTSGTNFTGCPCSAGETKDCYTGPTGTSGVGACHGGTQACVPVANETLTSVFGACTGEVLPSTANACTASGDAAIALDASAPPDAGPVTCPGALTQWVPMSTNGAPPSMVAGPPLLWTGSEVMVFGGRGSVSPDGAVGDADQSIPGGSLYNPTTDSWRAMSTAGAPSGRIAYGVVWTGSKVILWGGIHDALGVSGYTSTPVADGGIYDPVADSWVAIPSPTSLGLASGPAAGPRIVGWTGTELAIFGGASEDGWFYNPTTQTYRPFGGGLGILSPIQPGGVAAWGASRAMQWGGDTASGAFYKDPASAWTSMSASPLSARAGSDVVWAGNQLFVHGGEYEVDGDGGGTIVYPDDGAMYDPVANTWAPLPAGGGSRSIGSVVWTGCDVIEIGGEDSDNTAWRSAMRYTPATSTWTSLPALPTRFLGEENSGAVWAGNQLVVFGSGGDQVWSMFAYRLTQ